ncbi:MAG TPA: hypothetical protein H9698_07275 [Candidatus Ruthenibacterium merdavium]|uniref:Uncharacterized protein n=1 Tax=Candidatus Ruthenibacterium merdavium TaxID=2838752 RepID=A0A9D2Q4A0_9FIRM|nr:hypothetical protein [Candidatus Ruthenibacterium merdavium]
MKHHADKVLSGGCTRKVLAKANDKPEKSTAHERCIFVKKMKRKGKTVSVFFYLKVNLCLLKNILSKKQSFVKGVREIASSNKKAPAVFCGRCETVEKLPPDSERAGLQGEKGLEKGASPLFHLK